MDNAKIAVEKDWHKLGAVKVDLLKILLSGDSNAYRTIVFMESGMFLKSISNGKASEYALLSLDLSTRDSDKRLSLSIHGKLDDEGLDLAAVFKCRPSLLALIAKIYVFGLGAKSTVEKIMDELQLRGEIHVEENTKPYFGH